MGFCYQWEKKLVLLEKRNICLVKEAETNKQMLKLKCGFVVFAEKR